MTTLLVIIVLVLVAIAIWQMTKMFELSQPANDTAGIATDEDNKLNGNLMFAFLVFIYILTIYSLWKWGPFVLSVPASEHGQDYDRLMWISFALIFIVQFITQALLHYFAYKYRGQKGKKALFYADNDKLEFIWTVIPVITLSGLILYGLYTWNVIMNVDEDENPLVIELYAQQFSWTARYAGDDNVLGDANVRLNDIVVQEIHLPVNRKVLFKMRSQDVLHSAYMPHFRAQMNCVPGMITQFAFTPTMTTKDMRMQPETVEHVKVTNEIRAEKRANGEDADPWEFDYVLLCNKICGKSHYNMQMKIIVETEEEYNEWISQQQTFGDKIAAQ